MSTDAIIAEAFAPAAAQAQPKTITENEGADEAPEVDNEVVADEPDDKETDVKKTFEQLPKKVANKISRQDRRIGQLTAEKYQLKQELESLKSKGTPNAKSEDAEPREEDYANKTWGEYQRDLAAFHAKKAFSETKVKDTQQRADQVDTEIEAERLERRAELADAARKTFTDFDVTLNKAFQGIKLKPHVIEALDEADNGTHALYALAKEGFNFSELNDLTPAKAAMLIARYEDKGLTLSKTKQVTKAPTPMTPAKGLGAASGKPLDQMTGDELNKWRKS